jgi:signal transduction histidine kinase
LKYSFFCYLFLVLLSACSKKKHQQVPHGSNPLYDKAHVFNDSGVLDSAFFYFNQAKDIFSQNRDSLGVGKCLLNMAMISNVKGDDFGAQELSLNAIAFFSPYKVDQHIYIQSNYNNLGMTSYDLGDFSRAIEFYNMAGKYTPDSANVLIIKNNIANSYRRGGDLQKSISIYSHILSQKLSEREFSRTLSNFAYTKWLQNPGYNAAPELIRALRIRQEESDLQGQISSYTFLTDYYSLQNPKRALSYANSLYTIAKKISHPNDRLEALQRLIKLSPEEQSKKYFIVHQDLADSLQTARNAAKNQFALIRYESEKSKSDNWRLQKENREKTYQVNQQKIVTYFIVSLMIIGGSFAFYFQRKRKERLMLSAQNKIKEARLKTSKKVHDVVANGLYKVMTEIENQSGIGKEEILDRLDLMYQKSRDISYEVEEQPSETYVHKLNTLLMSFESERIQVAVKGNSEDLWMNANGQVQNEVEHILQELLVNMDKHSQATRVTFIFRQRDGRIYITYQDNGIGISEETRFNNGLNNTGNRIKNINGEITFDSKLRKGLQIEMSFPVS